MTDRNSKTGVGESQAPEIEPEKQKNIIKLSSQKLCVIITNKKNSSWIDDLDARDKLNALNRIYH